MIKGLHHVAICTRDIDRLIAFYRDRLGFSVVFQRNKPTRPDPGADAMMGLQGASYRVAMLKASNVSLELFEFAAPPGKAGDPQRPVCNAGITHICLSVSDIQYEYARLKEGGMTFHCPPQKRPGAGQATYGRDPDGNVIELIEIDPESVLAQ